MANDKLPKPQRRKQHFREVKQRIINITCMLRFLVYVNPSQKNTCGFGSSLMAPKSEKNTCGFGSS